jgi:hypothetical protein
MRPISYASLIGVAMLMATGSAQAADKVDCSRLDLQFPPAANADWIECEHFKHSDGHVDGATADVEMMTADMGTHLVHIASVVAGMNTYFDKKPVSEKLRNWEELEKFADVRAESDFKRFQIIRFRASVWKTAVECFGFIKYMGASITQGGGSYGSKGYVTGYDCWRDGTPDRAQIEATLDAIDD